MFKKNGSLFWFDLTLIAFFLTVVSVGDATQSAVVEEFVESGQNDVTGNATYFNGNISICNAKDVPLYKLVIFIVNETEVSDPKVRDIHIKHFYYYTHIYLASLQQDALLSLVAIQSGNIVGANMVYSVEVLRYMFAPKEIANVLDFVLPCYEAARPQGANHSGGRSIISTLRPTKSIDINRNIIAKTTDLFKKQTPKGSYHLLWENKTTMHEFLIRENYVQLYCGNDPQRNLCDWTRMGLAPSVAQDLCLYRLINGD